MDLTLFPQTFVLCLGACLGLMITLDNINDKWLEQASNCGNLDLHGTWWVQVGGEWASVYLPIHRILTLLLTPDGQVAHSLVPALLCIRFAAESEELRRIVGDNDKVFCGVLAEVHTHTRARARSCALSRVLRYY